MLDCQLCWRRCLRALLVPANPLARTSFSPISPSQLQARFYAKQAKTKSAVTKPKGKVYRRPPGKKRKGPRTYPKVKPSTFVDASGLHLRATRDGGRVIKRPGSIITKVIGPPPRRYNPIFGDITPQDRQAFRAHKYTEKSARGKGAPVREFEIKDAAPPKPDGRVFSVGRTDPAKLALQIRARLKESPEARLVALETVRTKTSEGEIDTTAAWNALIQHSLAIGDVAGAFRIYNEMKKRGKVPNEHTYTTILNGLSEPQNSIYPSTLPRALATYNSLKEASTKAGAGVKLNVIHTNAMLKVCARTGALDTMWEVVGSLPERGASAPDATTYTTFLNGLKNLSAPLVTEPTQTAVEGSATELASVFRPKAIRSNAPEDVIEDAKRLWAGLLSRWTKGDFTLDEHLISAMGRLLLSSPTDTDIHSVFQMISDIYKIPNFYLERTKDGEKAPTTPEDPKKATWKPLMAPHASNSTLSLLLEAVSQLRAPIAVGDSYVKYFTEKLNIQMDVENYHSYLRLLRMFREANLAIEVIEKMAAPFLQQSIGNKAAAMSTKKPAKAGKGEDTSSLNTLPAPTTKAFLLALSACRRKGGRAAFYPSALRILEIFEKMPVQTSPTLLRVFMTTDIPKVYTAFLDLALFHGDAPTLKHALKRVTSPSVARDGQLPTLPQLLAKRTTRTDDVMNFARTILNIARRLLEGEFAGWGHGERTALRDNYKMLESMVGSDWERVAHSERATPEWKEAPAAFERERSGPAPSSHLSKEEKLAMKEARREEWKRKMAAESAKARGRGGEGERREPGEAAEDWLPSSARDRGAKQFSRSLNGGAQEAYVPRSRMLAEDGGRPPRRDFEDNRGRGSYGGSSSSYPPPRESGNREGRSWPREREQEGGRFPPRREFADRGREDRPPRREFSGEREGRFAGGDRYERREGAGSSGNGSWGSDRPRRSSSAPPPSYSDREAQGSGYSRRSVKDERW